MPRGGGRRWARRSASTTGSGCGSAAGSAPHSLRGILGRVPTGEREAWEAFAAGAHKHGALLLEYRMDGRRTLAEVCRQARPEGAEVDTEYAVRFCRLLAAAEVVRLREMG